MSRRPAQSTRNFFASGKPQALGFWSCGEAGSEQAACLGVRPPRPCPTWKASFSGAGAGLTPRLAPCAAVPGNRHKGPCGTGRRSRGQRGGSHDRTWQGLGRTSRARLTMVPRSSAQTLLPHSSRPGPEERGAGTDATRSTVVGGASAGAEQRHSASRGRREGVPF